MTLPRVESLRQVFESALPGKGVPAAAFVIQTAGRARDGRSPSTELVD